MAAGEETAAGRAAEETVVVRVEVVRVVEPKVAEVTVMARVVRGVVEMAVAMAVAVTVASVATEAVKARRPPADLWSGRRG